MKNFSNIHKSHSESYLLLLLADSLPQGDYRKDIILVSYQKHLYENSFLSKTILEHLFTHTHQSSSF